MQQGRSTPSAAPEAPQIIEVLIGVVLKPIRNCGSSPKPPHPRRHRDPDDSRVGVAERDGVAAALVALGEVEDHEVAETSRSQQARRSSLALCVGGLPQAPILHPRYAHGLPLTRRSDALSAGSGGRAPSSRSSSAAGRGTRRVGRSSASARAGAGGLFSRRYGGYVVGAICCQYRERIGRHWEPV